MTNGEINELVEQYFKKEWKGFPPFEHRYDPDSSAIMYSLIRRFKPKKVLEIGSWLGGSTCIIQRALMENKTPSKFICSEIDDELRNKTEENLKEYCGKAPLMVGDITKSLDKIPDKLDFMFVDTNHDREVTQWIVENLWDRLVPGGIFAMHDWAVWEEEGGEIKGKGDNGTGALPETEYLMDLYRSGKFPFKKIYWSYKNPAWPEMNPLWESAFWEKTK